MYDIILICMICRVVCEEINGTHWPGHHHHHQPPLYLRRKPSAMDGKKHASIRSLLSQVSWVVVLLREEWSCEDDDLLTCTSSTKQNKGRESISYGTYIDYITIGLDRSLLELAYRVTKNEAMAPLHVTTLTVQRELPKYLASMVSTLPLYQEWNHGSTSCGHLNRATCYIKPISYYSRTGLPPSLLLCTYWVCMYDVCVCM